MFVYAPAQLPNRPSAPPDRPSASPDHISMFHGRAWGCRIRLLKEGEEGGLSAAARGFETCQLHTRHWDIRDGNGQSERVDGPGVVGKFPLLREGGWRDDAQVGGRSARA